MIDEKNIKDSIVYDETYVKKTDKCFVIESIFIGIIGGMLGAIIIILVLNASSFAMIDINENSNNLQNSNYSVINNEVAYQNPIPYIANSVGPAIVRINTEYRLGNKRCQ